MASLPASPGLAPTTATITTIDSHNESVSMFSSSKSTPSTPTAKLNRVLKRMGNWISKKRKDENYKIEYSILQAPKGVNPLLESEFMTQYNSARCNRENYLSVIDFNRLINDIVAHIDIQEFEPIRISRGSSGSYFVRDGTGQVVGVFKPKSEEPYGKYQPKWGKWLQKNILGLLGFNRWFGRLCLINNQAYISEAMTSYMDQRLLSFIVPYTDIIYLKSRAFYYGWNKVNWKIGSFQKFLVEYKEANEWFQSYPIPYNMEFNDFPEVCKISKGKALKFFWNKQSLSEFIIELEKLVLLDYLIRNTDRSLENWMIKIDWLEENGYYIPKVKIGAIDSGLSFPWKHPNEWRSFPYGWMQLPPILINQSFDKETRIHYARILGSREWWETTIIGLKKIYKKTKDFHVKNWQYQLSVIKGQAFNILKVLSIANSTPHDLINQPSVRIVDEYMKIPKRIDNSVIHNAINSSIRELYNEDRELPNGQNKDAVSPTVNGNSNPFGDEHRIITELETVVIERMDTEANKPPVFKCC